MLYLLLLLLYFPSSVYLYYILYCKYNMIIDKLTKDNENMKKEILLLNEDIRKFRDANELTKEYDKLVLLNKEYINRNKSNKDMIDKLYDNIIINQTEIANKENIIFQMKNNYKNLDYECKNKINIINNMNEENKILKNKLFDMERELIKIKGNEATLKVTILKKDNIINTLQKQIIDKQK